MTGAAHRLEQLRGPHDLLQHTVGFLLADQVFLVTLHVASLDKLDDSVGMSGLVDERRPGSEHQQGSDRGPRNNDDGRVESRDIEARENGRTHHHAKECELDSVPDDIVI